MPDPAAAPDPEVETYLRHLSDERQLSDHTVSAYRRDLRDLVTFLDEHRGGRPSWTWNTVERADLRSFLGWARRRGLTRRTIARKLSAVRGILRFLHAEGRIEKNPAASLRSPRAERRLPGHVGRADLEAIFAGSEQRGGREHAHGSSRARDPRAPVRKRVAALGAPWAFSRRPRSRQRPRQGSRQGEEGADRPADGIVRPRAPTL